MPRLPRSSALLALGALACSQDRPIPTAPTNPVFVISDARHSSGNAHFYFLPPLVPQPTTSGSFDPSLFPVVEVCEWNGHCGPMVARFTLSSGTGGSQVSVDAPGEQYRVNWDTKTCLSGQCTLDPAKTYRLRVLVATVELGFADVDIVANGSQIKNVQTNEYIGLVNGRTLPVKFRIEVGAIHVVPASGGGTSITPAVGGTVATADGGVVLGIPAGALPASGTPTTITVAPVASPPPDPNIVPGTSFEFGPDGTQFSQPVAVRIGYDPARLPGGVPEANLRLFTLMSGTWKLVPRSHVDPASHTVIGEVTHFSDYGVGGAAPVTGFTFTSFYGPVPGIPLLVDADFVNDNAPSFYLWVWGAPCTPQAPDPACALRDRPVDVISRNPSVLSIESVVLVPIAGIVSATVHVNVHKNGSAVLVVSSDGVVDSVVATANITPEIYYAAPLGWFDEPDNFGSRSGPNPVELAVGQEVQLEVIFLTRDNVRFAPPQTVWGLNDPLFPSHVTISGTGVVRGDSVGCTTVTATFHPLVQIYGYDLSVCVHAAPL